MRSRSLSLPFVVSMIAFPLLYVLAVVFGGLGEGDFVTRMLFGATVVVLALALNQAVAARRLFSPDDHGHITWTLILLFLAVRLVAEMRLVTLTFQLVPKYTDGASSGLYFYVIVLRYLYTLSDLFFIGALGTTIRAYKSTGLKFELMARDYVYMLLVWMMPVVTYVFRDNLIYSNAAGTDTYIATYRLVTVTVSALIVSLCLAMRRYALQMGGGAVARVWSMVGVAGLARGASFMALALISGWWRSGAMFTEQYLLWIFSCCWLMAAVCQQEVVPQSERSQIMVAAESKAVGG